MDREEDREDWVMDKRALDPKKVQSGNIWSNVYWTVCCAICGHHDDFYVGSNQSKVVAERAALASDWLPVPDCGGWVYPECYRDLEETRG